jgi:glycosyltransferase involved in cell wall biosynthesis
MRRTKKNECFKLITYNCRKGIIKRGNLTEPSGKDYYKAESRSIYKMRIFISCEALSYDTAQTTQVIEISENLELSGNKTFIFAPGTRKYRGDKKINITYVPTVDLFILRSISYQFFLFFYMGIMSIKTKPNVIYTRIGMFSIAPLVLSKILRTPHVIHLADDIIEDMVFVKTNAKVIGLCKNMEKINCIMSQKITTPTEGIKKSILERYKIREDKVSVISNGANTEMFKPGDKEESRQNLRLNGKIYICFIGSLVRWQGLEYLIRAAPDILEHCPETSFLIVGDGPQLQELREQVNELNLSNKVIFTGAVPYRDIPKYINASDICVAPFIKTRNESMGLSPLKIFEYGACGKAIVASRINSLIFIEEQGMGILVDPENPEEIAKALVTLLKDKELMEKMSKKGSEYITTTRTWRSAARTLESIFNSMIQEN